MSDLIVVGFKKDIFRASQVLNDLNALSAEWVIDLRDAVAVYRDDSGGLRVDHGYHMTAGEGAGWGAFWGSLIGLTLATPLSFAASAAVATGAVAAGALGGGALGAAGGALNAQAWRDTYGIADDFIKEVGAMVRPGDSAIFALVRSADPTYVAEQFRGYGGMVLRSNLPQEKADELQAVLDGKK